jgi:nicotinate phosphoribosyltransferase
MANNKLRNTGLYTDYYELSMAQGYYFAGKKDEKTVFDYFFRTNPYQGGFLVFAGLADLLDALKEFKYDDEELNYLGKNGLHPEFINYLRDFRFMGKINSVREGEIVFPHETLVRVEGNIIEAQLIETLLLNILNFQSLIATNAFRTKLVAKEKLFSDFGLRRAHGTGGIQASRACIIGGAASTSNVLAGFLYNLPISGTMAHSWVQSFDNELLSFRTYAKFNPTNTILLVDTYDTLRSGVPNAIIIAKEMEADGHRLKGIRLDSGDLAYLSKKARKMLDHAGLQYVRIIASNQLNENVVKSLEEQGAQIEGFGIGTELVTGKPDAALDGVYKLAECNGIPRMKISENIEKTTLPGKKSLYRFFDEDDNFFRDGMFLETEDVNSCEYIVNPMYPEKKSYVKNLTKELLHQTVFEDGEITYSMPTPQESHQYLLKRAAKLPEEHKRFIMPHIYKVGISDHLLNLRNELLSKYNRR